MRRDGLLGVLALAVALGAGPAAATGRTARPGPVRDDAVGGDLGAGRSDRLEVERAAVTAHARRLGADPAELRLEWARRSLIGSHVRGRQYRDGVPVAGTSVGVHTVGGRVVAVRVTASSLPGGPVAAAVPESAALAGALARLGLSSAERSRVERLLVPAGRRLVDTWRVHVLSLAPAVTASVDIAAASGEVMDVRDDSRHVEATAKLFDPSPVVTLRNASLRQPGETGGLVEGPEADSAELSAARVSLPLRDLDAGAMAFGRLSGPHVWVQTPLPLEAPGGSFDLPRSDPRFEGLMSYAHLDRLQRYLAGLGFTGERAVNAEPQDVYAVRAEGLDNSLYYPPLDVIVFGTGGVDDAEDAEVVLHEYGHAVQDAQVPGWAADGEAGAMGEGFGDFLAAAYLARTSSGGFGDVCMFDWDSTSLAGGEPRCTRRLDSAKTYADRVNSKHEDGEIWSSFLWRLRAHLGGSGAERSDNALRLVLTSQELMPPDGTMADGVHALTLAARGLGRPQWVAAIRSEAARSKLALPPA